MRTAVDAQARFAGAHDPDRMTALARTRLHASGLRATTLAEGGTDGLRRLLEERIQQHGGDVRAKERVERVNVRRGRATSVTPAGTEEEVGCAFVVTSLDAAAAQRLTACPRRALRRPDARRAAALPPLRAQRRAAGEALPVGMARASHAVADLKRPLAEENLLAVECGAPDAEGARC